MSFSFLFLDSIPVTLDTHIQTPLIVVYYFCRRATIYSRFYIEFQLFIQYFVLFLTFRKEILDFSINFN